MNIQELAIESKINKLGLDPNSLISKYIILGYFISEYIYNNPNNWEKDKYFEKV